VGKTCILNYKNPTTRHKEQKEYLTVLNLLNFRDFAVLMIL